MKRNDIQRKYIMAMIALSACLLILWVMFYYLTLTVIRRNMKLQAETASNEIITSVEEELLSMEDAAYAFSHDPDVADMVGEEDATSFYALGDALTDKYKNMAYGLSAVDHVVIFNVKGDFYRLKGSASNTALKRTLYLMEGNEEKIVAVTNNGKTYIGTSEGVYIGGVKKGYVVLLLDQTRISRIMNAYNALDYLGVALLGHDKLLYSNKDIRIEDMEGIKDRAVFVKEKDIGLSGYKLSVWGIDSISSWLSTYFKVALPITFALLIFIIWFFTRYLKRHMVEPIELEKERSLTTLLKKQINAHFTVNTLNAVRALINKGEKEAAAHVCDELSILLRYANAGDEYISLLQEFYVIAQYIGIMQVRYPDRIEAEIEEDDAFSEIMIPRMLIQPIVENAIEHGLSEGKGTVRLSASIGDEVVMIRVDDDGAGMDEKALEDLREAISAADSGRSDDLKHIALQNIERRIRLVCGEKYGIHIESKPNEGTSVYVCLPLKKANPDDEKLS